MLLVVEGCWAVSQVWLPQKPFMCGHVVPFEARSLCSKLWTVTHNRDAPPSTHTCIPPPTLKTPPRAFCAPAAADPSLPCVLLCPCCCPPPFRHRGHDFIYESELNSAVEAGALSKLHVAFSRMGAKKDYVQHHMEAQAGGEGRVCACGWVTLLLCVCVCVLRQVVQTLRVTLLSSPCPNPHPHPTPPHCTLCAHTASTQPLRAPFTRRVGTGGVSFD